MKKMKQKALFIFSICLSLFTVAPLAAQQATIKATADSTHILIGQQTFIRLDITLPENMEAQLPFIPDTLTAGIEVLTVTPPDTVQVNDNQLRIQYNYLVTSFYPNLYLIPPFRLVVGNDTILSNDLALKVSTYPVDTESKEFFDIKPIWQPNFVLKDYLPILFGILGGIILTLAAIYLIYRIRNKKSLLPSFKKEEPQLPPHVLAMQGLNDVKEQKLWQQGKVKEFHSEVTDILRKYIEGRFGIPALEMTSEEILDKMRSVEDSKPVFDHLKQLLLLADFVKFAKFQPLPDENETSLTHAYLFVEQTTLQPEKSEEEVNEIQETGNVSIENSDREQSTTNAQD